MVNIPCDYCGRPASTVVDTEDNCSCVNCYKQFYTCAMCENASKCEFETNPSPLPKVVQQTVRQGPMIMTTQVKNPERIREFCHICQCWNTSEQFCGREDNWCPNYIEITPRFRQERLKNT